MLQLTRRFAFSILVVIFTMMTLNFICLILLTFNIGPVHSSTHQEDTAETPILPYQIPQSLSQSAKFPLPPPIPHLEPDDQTAMSEPFMDPASGNLLHQKNFKGRASNKVPKKNITIFDYNIATDSYRRRLASPPGTARTSPRHLLLLGCSYVFGTGVDNQDTMAWNINTLQKTYEAYNNGFGGFSTADVLWLMESKEATAGIQQKRGIAVYTFIAGHAYRNINSTVNGFWTRTHSSFSENSPYAFTYEGNFEKAHPLRTAVYEFLSETSLFRFFGIHLPRLTKQDLSRMVRMIAKIRDLYLEQTNKENKFVVSIYPEPMNAVDIDYIKKALSKEEIYFIDYSVTNIEKAFDHNIRIPYDGHPTGEAHKLYAETLFNDLNSYFESATSDTVAPEE